MEKKEIEIIIYMDGKERNRKIYNQTNLKIIIAKNPRTGSN